MATGKIKVYRRLSHDFCSSRLVRCPVLTLTEIDRQLLPRFLLSFDSHRSSRRIRAFRQRALSREVIGNLGRRLAADEGCEFVYAGSCNFLY